MNVSKEKKTVLVVDDQEAFLQAVVDEVKFLGFQTQAAKDGQQAFEMAQNNSFDLIISDIRMPNKDGRWFLMELRKHKKTNPPFLFMTGFADLSVSEAYAMGVDGFLGKPLNPDKLENLLNKLIRPIESRWIEEPKEKPIHHIAKKYPISIEDKSLNQLSLGRGGVYLSFSNLAFEVGDLVAFKFEFASGSIALLEGIGNIVWKKENPEGVSDEYGLYFDFLSPQTLPGFLEFLNKQERVEVIPQGISKEKNL